MEAEQDKKYPEYVLFVDDEINVLNGIKRQLRNKYNILVATGPQEGFEMLEENKNIAIVVSDMRMPIINGSEFLKVVKKDFPKVIRVMLTGNSDRDTAVLAVNKGNVFRFMSKPCDTDTMEATLENCFHQYYLQRAERDLIEKTLLGSVNVLVDILSLSNPIAFSRTRRIKHYASELATYIGYKEKWKVEMAASLSQIGCITIPTQVMTKYYNGEELVLSEKEMIQAFPKIGTDLLKNIPRMNIVSKIILDSFGDDGLWLNRDVEMDTLPVWILRLAMDYDLIFRRTADKAKTITLLSESESMYHPKLIKGLHKMAPAKKTIKIEDIAPETIRVGMILNENVRTTSNVLLATKGQEVNSTMCIVINNYNKQGMLPPVISVKITDDM